MCSCNEEYFTCASQSDYPLFIDLFIILRIALWPHMQTYPELPANSPKPQYTYTVLIGSWVFLKIDIPDIELLLLADKSFPH